MKTNYFITLSIVILSSFNLQSQQLFQEGNQWTYATIDWNSGDLTYTKYKVNGDTAINNNVYKKIYTKSESSNNVYELEEYFVRQDPSGKSFKIDSSLEEVLMIDNSLSEGASIALQSTCEFRLDRIDSVQLNNNIWTNRIIYSYKNLDPLTGDPVFTSINGFQWIENIGNLRHPFFGSKDYCPSVSLDTYTALACFVSDDVLLYGIEEHCSEYLLNTEVLPYTDITVFPNPFDQEFRIKIAGNQGKINRLLVLDISGNLYQEKNELDSLNIVIDTKDFPSGMYLVKVILSNGKSITKKVLKL